jgi:hypothetical protein
VSCGWRKQGINTECHNRGFQLPELEVVRGRIGLEVRAKAKILKETAIAELCGTWTTAGSPQDLDAANRGVADGSIYRIETKTKVRNRPQGVVFLAEGEDRSIGWMVNSTCNDWNCDIAEALVPIEGGKPRLALIIKARKTIKLGDTLWTNYDLGKGVECKCGRGDCGNVKTAASKATRKKKQSPTAELERKMAAWYDANPLLETMTPAPDGVEQAVAEIAEVAEELALQQGARPEGKSLRARMLYTRLKSMRLAPGEVKQMEEARNFVRTALALGFDDYVIRLSEAQNKIVTSRDPSGFLAMVLEAEMDRVSKGELRVDPATAEGAGLEATGTGWIILELRWLLQGGVLLPPDHLASFEPKDLSKWGEAGHAVLARIKWWQANQLLSPGESWEPEPLTAVK